MREVGATESIQGRSNTMARLSRVQSCWTGRQHLGALVQPGQQPLQVLTRVTRARFPLVTGNAEDSDLRWPCRRVSFAMLLCPRWEVQTPTRSTCASLRPNIEARWSIHPGKKEHSSNATCSRLPTAAVRPCETSVRPASYPLQRQRELCGLQRWTRGQIRRTRTDIGHCSWYNWSLPC